MNIRNYLLWCKRLMRQVVLVSAVFLLVIGIIFKLSPTNLYAQTATTYWNAERNTSTNFLNFYLTTNNVAGTPALTIDNVGKVGIGAAAPAGPLHVAGQGSIFGSASGSMGAPTISNTNLQLYRNSATNWAGMGADTAGSMYFVTGTTAPSTKLMIAADSGNLGVGTTAPTARLHVSYPGTPGTIAAKINHQGNGSNPGTALAVSNGYYPGGGAYEIFGVWANNFLTSGLLSVRDNGNVGIGTNTPSQKLDVSGNIRSYNTIMADTSLSTPITYDSNNAAYYTDLNGSSRLENIYATYIRSYSQVTADTIMNAQYYVDLNNGAYYVDPNGTNRMANIYADYLISYGIITANSYLTSPRMYDLDNAGYYVDANSLSRMSTIYLDAGYAQASDARLKKNIEPIPQALDKITQLKGVTFEYRHDDPKRNFPDGRHMGFIAQEVEKVLPDVVTTDETGYKWLAYDTLVALLNEGIKEQQEEIKTLKQNNLEQDKEIINLKQEVELLKQEFKNIKH